MVSGKSPEPLPPGFTEKVRVTSGRRIKVYTEVSTGSTFYSRPAIFRYLKALENNSGETEQNEPEKMGESEPELPSDANPIGEEDSFEMFVTESETVEKLPPGWRKEIKIKKSGGKTRRDPFYTDPVSGYMFRSFKDAERYLKTNDIRSCICRPIKKKLDNVKPIENEIPDAMQPTPIDEKLPEALETSEKYEVKGQLFPDGNVDGDGESSGTKDLVELAFAKAENLEENPHETNAEMTKEPKPAKEGTEPEAKLVAEGVTDPETKLKLPESGLEIQTSAPQSGTRKSKKRKESTLPLRASKRLAGREPDMLSGSNLNERALRSAAKISSANEIDNPPLTSPDIAPEPTTIRAPVIEPAKEIPPVIEPAKEVPPVIEPAKEVPPVIEPAKEVPPVIEPAKEVPPVIEPAKEVPPVIEPAKEVPPVIEPAKEVLELSFVDKVDKSPDFSPAVALTSDIKPAEDAKENASVGTETPQEIEPPNDVSKPLGENPAIPIEQIDEEQPDESNGLNLEIEPGYGYGDTWFDPCIAFAYRTLTGEMPLDDRCSGYLGDQQFSNSYNLSDGGLGLSETNPANILQSDILAQNDPPMQNGDGSPDPLPANPSSFGNMGFPTCSGFSSQQSGAEAKNKDFQTKVGS